jgi:prepilin-type N-terminal cleavage/methylation domain-containing protein
MNFPLSTFHFPFGRCSRRSGFSLIEILVATTILLVIVILASLVFQQTTGAYQTGERKVNAQVALRNVVGALTRDLALAVDSDHYSGVDNDFSEGSLSFVALTGTPGRDVRGEENDKSKDYRTARYITYSSNGQRTEHPMTCRWENGQLKWKKEGGVTSSLFDKDSYSDDQDTHSKVTFNMTFDYDGPPELPERVYIRVELDESARAAVVGAGSGGRRGWDYEDDNIYVGYKPPSP